ncbi:hypothetical protein [Candidatus Symbiopectobacterium sp.]|uniref:hypothetical protein n=1 Tax=Candidatus Symbiopectobacterium sp. TaxID=2816440 RepID=UPI0025BBCABF|nr:hypothetical protein [Candidatus Symbiopectobacterium sp.]
MLNPELGDASRSDQHFNPKQACHNSIIPYYSTKPNTLPEIADSLTSRIHDRFQVLKPAS